MKLKAPDGCRMASHRGSAVPIANDGMVEVDDEIALVLIAHGFCPVEKGKGEQAVSSKRDESSGQPETKPDNPDAQPRDIGALSRKELFTFLKAKGVAVALPVTNIELCAAARRARDG
jgi:hypothetical protein